MLKLSLHFTPTPIGRQNQPSNEATKATTIDEPTNYQIIKSIIRNRFIKPINKNTKKRLPQSNSTQPDPTQPYPNQRPSLLPLLLRNQPRTPRTHLSRLNLSSSSARNVAVPMCRQPSWSAIMSRSRMCRQTDGNA